MNLPPAKAGFIILSSAFLVLDAASRGATSEEQKAPVRLPASRYATLRTALPFAVASVPPGIKPEPPDWAHDFSIGAAAKMRLNGADVSWVTLRNQADPTSLIVLDSSGSSSSEYQLLKLDYAEDLRRTSAEVRKGSQVAKVSALPSAAVPLPGIPPRPAPAGSGRMTPNSGRKVIR